MSKINIGLIGCGTVGAGVIKILKNQNKTFLKRFQTEFVVKKICDKNSAIAKKIKLSKNLFTTKANDVLDDENIDVIIELIGGTHPAKEFILQALRSKKHVITANKAVIAKYGPELFKEAIKQKKNIYFESSVGAGVPIINAITEGLAGNNFTSLYGIINGTSNFILSEMTQTLCTFADALIKAQKNGYAESNPTLDVNGMDAAHKLSILVHLAFGKVINLKNIHVEGITQISHDDIKYAKDLGLVIKPLAIAKMVNNALELRVHPTLIDEDHPLASVNGVFNAIFLETDPLGDILLYGQGAGQLAAASGVVSDLINLATKGKNIARTRMKNIAYENRSIKLKQIDQIETKFYIRLLVTNKPGVLSKISGILGKHGISIGSVNQKTQKKASVAPLVMLTDLAKEKKLRIALEKISKLALVKSKPVAIRMENL
ncbi:MAG: homoserine dehydrogenase [Candidatus Omnitrophica bacterium]|nr:homoserine dehydrogenase [Candidatus Omnitrophota bacterium]